jgi:hypothetical protein
MYPKIRYASDIQTSLRQISELIIQDALESKEVEEVFYQKCYCESGALSKYALLSKEMLQARYAALFSDSESSPQITSVKPDRKEQSLDPSIMLCGVLLHLQSIPKATRAFRMSSLITLITRKR